MKAIHLNIEICDIALTPAYATRGSAAMDLRSRVSADIPPGKRLIIPTGLRIQLPEGYCAEVQPRSGLAIKHGITVLNTPGLIDSDYRGEIGVILVNHSDQHFNINYGDRIAQLKVSEYVRACVEIVPAIDMDTERGTGGFGSTGK
jgi:dUTP pyrophosphatase